MPATLTRFIAGQLRQPSGLFGKHLTSRVLNRVSGPMNQRTVELLELHPGERVLEVGFGGGDLIDRMAGIVSRGRIVGVDFSSAMVELGRRRFARLIESGRLELHCASAEQLPHDAGQFTKACTVNTVYFWSDPLVALGELRRTLRDGGRLVLSFNPRATAQKLPYTRHGFTLYDGDEMQHLLAEAGFREVRLVTGTQKIGEFMCAVGTK